MKTYAEIQAELARLKALDLKVGDWVWLRVWDDQPLQKAQLRGTLAAVTLVVVAPEDASDDGLRVVTPDRIKGRVE